jgi:hypothetical protein
MEEIRPQMDADNKEWASLAAKLTFLQWFFRLFLFHLRESASICGSTFSNVGNLSSLTFRLATRPLLSDKNTS